MPSSVSFKPVSLDFPGGSVVKSPLGRAGDVGLIPWPGAIPRATGQLSPGATTPTTESVCPGPVL